jgi:hypothetical protein
MEAMAEYETHPRVLSNSTAQKYTPERSSQSQQNVAGSRSEYIRPHRTGENFLFFSPSYAHSVRPLSGNRQIT